MWPASKVIPKELFPLGKLPAIVHLVSELAAAGIRNVILVVSEQSLSLIRALFDPSIAPPSKSKTDPLTQAFEALLATTKITVVPQKGTYGNATPLITVADQLDGPCIYAFGDDVVFGENATRGLKDTYAVAGRPVLAVQRVSPSRISSFGIIEGHNENGILFVDRLIEKPSPQETTSTLASFGRYVVTEDLLETLLRIRPGREGEVWFVDGIIEQLKQGQTVCAFPLTKGTWYTVGDPVGYAQAVAAAAKSLAADAARDGLQASDAERVEIVPRTI